MSCACFPRYFDEAAGSSETGSMTHVTWWRWGRATNNALSLSLFYSLCLCLSLFLSLSLSLISDAIKNKLYRQTIHYVVFFFILASSSLARGWWVGCARTSIRNALFMSEIDQQCNFSGSFDDKSWHSTGLRFTRFGFEKKCLIDHCPFFGRKTLALWYHFSNILTVMIFIVILGD